MNVGTTSDFLLEADHAERAKDLATATSKLRAHLIQHPEDSAIRLRLARLLLEMAEWSSARGVLSAVDQHSTNDGWNAQANRLLAALEEQEGALTSARVRWERVLADDIDDPEARAHLKTLGAHASQDQAPTSLSLGTLASPEGVHLSRFKLVREIGRGSSAAVYLVLDERLDLPLALKVLHPQLAAAARTAARERFFAEARLATRLRHPGVVAIYGVDETARCLAMEFIAGGTVRDRLRPDNRPTRVDADEVRGTARSLLGALAYVHDAGIVHGDLKPGNVLLRRPTEVVLADFGAAALTFDVRDASDHVGGTPLYQAPEQFRGAPPSVRTDLFAAGAILWEMLDGHPTRRRSDLLSGAYATPTTEPRSLRTDITGDLSSLITALLSQDPASRPANAHVALALLEP